MQSTTYHGREYVREVFNESTKSKGRHTIYTLSVLFLKRTRNILESSEQSIFKGRLEKSLLYNLHAVYYS